MSLSIGPLEAGEITDYVRIQLTAFTSTTARILYAPSPETADDARSKNLELLKNDPNVYFQKVFDPITGDVMSYAKWKIYLTGRDEVDISPRSVHSSQDVASKWEDRAKSSFHNALSQFLREFMGTQPFYHLDMLMTDPRFARRGAAQKVIEWGIAEADSRQLPIYLESSLMARPLYERNGFRVVQDFAMGLADYGGIGVEKVAIMIRTPRSA